MRQPCMICMSNASKKNNNKYIDENECIDSYLSKAPFADEFEVVKI